MLKITRIGYSDQALELMLALRFNLSVSKYMCQGAWEKVAECFYRHLHDPASFIYFAFVEQEFAGVFVSFPLHWNSYEAHIMFAPVKKLRKYCVELGKMAIACFWKDAPEQVTHTFGYIPKVNRPALLAVKKMGFKWIADIPGYAKFGDNLEDVELLMLRRI